MNDRELLELAAKAAGLEVVTPTMLKCSQWNPLEDDGDALRLAVKLEMLVNSDVCEATATDGHVYTREAYSTTDNDKFAAARRAIVRAAAEIGKSIQD